MSSTSTSVEQRNQAASLYVGGLDERVDEDLLWELFTQAGPVHSVFIPVDKVTGKRQAYAFVEFKTEDDADYALKILNTVRVYSKILRLNKASAEKKTLDIGANIFIGNLSDDVDEIVLHNTFSAFGGITQPPHIVRRNDPNKPSSGYGFVSFDSFEAADAAIASMNGQFLGERTIVVQYAFKEGNAGARHGDQAERQIAAALRKKEIAPVNTNFSTKAGESQSSVPVPPSQANSMAALQSSVGILPPTMMQQSYPPPPAYPPMPMPMPMQMPVPMPLSMPMPMPGYGVPVPGYGMPAPGFGMPMPYYGNQPPPPPPPMPPQ